MYDGMDKGEKDLTVDKKYQNDSFNAQTKIEEINMIYASP
jgi:hypothetical protein